MESWRKELYHHGVKGQKWGVRRGPPYPIGEGKAQRGGRKSLDKPAGRLDNRVEKSYASSKSLSKAVKIGAVAALAGLAVYGAYKTGYLDKARIVGESYVRRALGEIGAKPLTGTAGSFQPPSNSNSQPSPPPTSKHQPVIRDPKTGFKLVHESLSDSLKNANPLKGKGGDNNCTYCAVAGFLRMQGYDVTAKSTGGKMQNLGGVLEDCFKGVRVYEGSATKFAKSPEDAAQMLRKRFGDNASGAVGIDWKGGGGDGHAFSWVIRDGVVQFFDFQNNRDDEFVRRTFWRYIDPIGNLTFARLDTDSNGNKLELNLDAIDKYVNGR